MFRRVDYCEVQNSSCSAFISAALIALFAVMLSISMQHCENGPPAKPMQQTPQWMEQPIEAIPAPDTPSDQALVDVESSRDVLKRVSTPSDPQTAPTTFMSLPRYSPGKYQEEFDNVWGPDRVASMVFIATFTENSRIVLNSNAKQVVCDEVMPRIKQQVYLAWLAADRPSDDVNEIIICMNVAHSYVAPYRAEIADMLLSANK